MRSSTLPRDDQSALQPLWLIARIICKCLEKTSLVLWGWCYTQTHTNLHTHTHARTQTQTLHMLLHPVIVEEMYN